ncbi:hypothetical protein OXYTRIMIC_318 [Oxytricha trifallax]|uniref:Uncharacterized protein n=1 Tax=Oxytricha trifallax TaxID=1172189 RepID=A0A073HZU4_9SPIT|nr:hypothetical protein OXYTRIMIC_318 [Oxytricha trifallax]
MSGRKGKGNAGDSDKTKQRAFSHVILKKQFIQEEEKEDLRVPASDQRVPTQTLIKNLQLKVVIHKVYQHGAINIGSNQGVAHISQNQIEMVSPKRSKSKAKKSQNYLGLPPKKLENLLAGRIPNKKAPKKKVNKESFTYKKLKIQQKIAKLNFEWVNQTMKKTPKEEKKWLREVGLTYVRGILEKMEDLSKE